YAWLSEKVNRIPCAGGGCQLTIPTIPGKIVNYQVQLLDVNGSVLFAGPLLKATGVAPAVVVGGPALSIAMNHSGPGAGGNFVQGKQGTYTISVSNSGGSPTSGTAIVTDTLPAHMTIASITDGGDWTCTPSPLQG